MGDFGLSVAINSETVINLYPFASKSCALMLSEKFAWAWDNVTLSERVTLPAKGRYPDASFDGFFIRGTQNFSCKPIRITEVSDHFPAVLIIAIE